MILRIVLIILLVLPGISYAQDTLKVVENDDNLKISYLKYNIGITPTAYFNYFQGVQISQDFGLGKRSTITTELAYIFNSVYGPYVHGVRFKPGIHQLIYRGGSAGIVLGFNGDLRYTVNDRELKLIFDEFNYEQKYNVKRHKRLLGGEMYLGCIIEVYKGLKIEMGGGIGYGSMKIEDSEDVFGASDSSFIFTSYDSPGTSPIVIWTTHFNISYDLVKN